MYAVTSKPCCTINGLLYFSSDTYGVLSSPQLQGVGKQRRGAAGLNDAPVPPLAICQKQPFPWSISPKLISTQTEGAIEGPSKNRNMILSNILQVMGIFSRSPHHSPVPKAPSMLLHLASPPPLCSCQTFMQDLNFCTEYPLAHRTNRPQSVLILKRNIQRASPRLSVSTQQHP